MVTIEEDEDYKDRQICRDAEEEEEEIEDSEVRWILTGNRRREDEGDEEWRNREEMMRGFRVAEKEDNENQSPY